MPAPVGMALSLSVIVDCAVAGKYISAVVFAGTLTFNSKLLIDYYIGYTGDDVHIIMTHKKGTDNKDIHKMAWDAFTYGTKIAKDQGLYGAGQDLLKDAFSGNVRGMGPGVAEIKIKL